MHFQEIKSHRDNTVIFSGRYASIIECLEYAAQKAIDLSGANLSNTNLSNANLDGLNMPDALLIGTNFSGANLSEARLCGGIFYHASLYNTCLCDSDLSSCDFRSASFGATDIAGADLSHCKFSTLSCFDLDFWSVRTMKDCLFQSCNGTLCEMSEHPVILKGILQTPIILMDRVAKIGQQLMPREILSSTIPALLQYCAENKKSEA